MFGKSRILEQYEFRIAELKAMHEKRIEELQLHIADLQRMVHSRTSASTIPLVTLEADSVLSQKEEAIEITPEELEKIQEIESEANRILSGNY